MNTKPTIKGGLQRGAKGTMRMASHPQGRKVLYYVVGSMFWIFFITGTGIIVGFAMYVAWIAFLVITRKKRGF